MLLLEIAVFEYVRLGKRVAVVDADVWGFSIPRMLGVERPPVYEDEGNVPADHWPFVLLEISAWDSWAEVAQFFASLWADSLAEAPHEIAEEDSRNKR